MDAAVFTAKAFGFCWVFAMQKPNLKIRRHLCRMDAVFQDWHIPH